LSEPLDAGEATWRANPVLELIAAVCVDGARTALTGRLGPEVRGVLAAVAPTRSMTRLAAGTVCERDVAALYRFDNRLVAVRMTGRQVREYLEWSARYFRRTQEPSVDLRRLRHAVVPDAPGGLPDYDLDVVVGDEPLEYDVDVSRSVGDRIRGLTYAGTPLEDDDEVVLVVTEYRHNGSRAYPHVRQAPVLWRGSVDVRELLRRRFQAEPMVEVARLRRPGWRLTVGLRPVRPRRR
jgi:2',3'-cyclic-nucleotide 2'-phosphodiesterase/3'-nucleotidase